MNSMTRGVTTDVYFKKCHEDARAPTQSIDDVGFDIHSVDELTIPAGGRRLVSTGVQISNVVWHPSRRCSPFFKVEGRSGLAAKHGVFPIGGIIDPSYRGEVKIILVNMGEEDFHIDKGDRIAQLVCYQTLANNAHHHMEWKECDWLAESNREAKGFGSSGR